MAFFGLLISLWLLLFLTSTVAWKEQLRSHSHKATLAFAGAFTFIGITHLVAPHKLAYMIDGLLPFPTLLVVASGVMEIALGLLLLAPRYRRTAAWGIIALLVLMFPANINVAIQNLPAPGGLPAEPWYVWSRLAFQPLYIGWIWWAALYRKNVSPHGLSTDTTP